MAWRDDLLPASLNGVPFLYRTVRGRGGRRGVKHEYPGRTEPFIRDLGPKGKEFSLQAFLLGDNYHVDRDSLLDVLDLGTDLQFIHPYRGLMTVKVLGDVETIEEDTKGGMASFVFTLYESGLAFPTIFIAGPPRVAFLGGLAVGAINAKTKFNLLKAIGDVIKSAIAAIDSAALAVAKVNGKISAALSLIDSAANAINDLSDNIGTLLNTPQALMSALTGALLAVFDLVKNFVPDVGLDTEVTTDPLDLVGITLETLRELMDFDTEPEAIRDLTTPQAEIEIAAHAAVKLAVQASAIAKASEVLVSLELDSATQASEIQVELAEHFNTVLATDDLDPEIYQALTALKSTTIAHLLSEQKRLPAVRTITPPLSIPAIVLAHDLYRDPDREDEIVARNGIRNPLFVPGLVPLEVLVA